MARILPLVLGAVAGAALVYVFAGLGQRDGTLAEPEAPPPSASPSAAEAPDPVSAPFRSVSGTFSERLNFIKDLERIDDVRELIPRIRRLAAGTRTMLEAFELDILLARLVRLDPSLSSLTAFVETKAASVIAIELLDVLGDDEASIEAVLRALPAVDPLSFRIDALAHATERDPAAALDRAVASDDPVVRRLGIAAVAATWASSDPRAALQSTGSLSEPGLRDSFVSAVLRRWSEFDANGALEYLAAADPSVLEQANSALEVLAFSDPERTIELSRRLNRRYAFAYVLTRAAQALAERDPAMAVAHLQSLPPGQAYRATRAGIAAGYAARDPVAALKWAQQLDSPSPAVVTDVLSATAALDLEQAFDLAIDAVLRGQTAGVGSLEWLSRNGASDAATMARIGERLAKINPAAAGLLVPRFAEAWSVSDPRAALDWALEHGAIGASMLPHIALNFPSVGLEEALDITTRLPLEYQSRWIQSAVVTGAGRLINEDPDRLLRLLARYEGLEGYDAMIRGIASSVSFSARFDNNSNAGRFAETLPEGDLKRAIEEAMGAMP